jgi:glucose-1-phosphate thymidylyltransferase
MNAVLICPDHREAAGFARRMKPLALLPIMGRALLDLWLEKLASEGVKQVTLLAADRPDQIRHAIGNGGRWGLKITVIPVASEPSIEQARLFAADSHTRV